jgi:hypothetical protein
MVRQTEIGTFAPSPLARIKGTTPIGKAMEFIRIGRSRAASSATSTIRIVFLS